MTRHLLESPKTIDDSGTVEHRPPPPDQRLNIHHPDFDIAYLEASEISHLRKSVTEKTVDWSNDPLGLGYQLIWRNVTKLGFTKADYARQCAWVRKQRMAKYPQLYKSKFTDPATGRPVSIKQKKREGREKAEAKRREQLAEDLQQVIDNNWKSLKIKNDPIVMFLNRQAERMGLGSIPESWGGQEDALEVYKRIQKQIQRSMRHLFGPPEQRNYKTLGMSDEMLDRVWTPVEDIVKRSREKNIFPWWHNRSTERERQTFAYRLALAQCLLHISNIREELTMHERELWVAMQDCHDIAVINPVRAREIVASHGYGKLKDRIARRTKALREGKQAYGSDLLDWDGLGYFMPLRVSYLLLNPEDNIPNTDKMGRFSASQRKGQRVLHGLEWTHGDKYDQKLQPTTHKRAKKRRKREARVRLIEAHATRARELLAALDDDGLRDVRDSVLNPAALAAREGKRKRKAARSVASDLRSRLPAQAPALDK